MQVEFLSKFSKDLDKIKSKKLKDSVHSLIEQFENSESLSKIHNVKKLSGHKNAYRIRLGDYRLGFFVENEIIQLARIKHRKEIYKLFP
jgi:addiction module RelE/StbE family toxin